MRVEVLGYQNSGALRKPTSALVSRSGTPSAMMAAVRMDGCFSASIEDSVALRACRAGGRLDARPAVHEVERARCPATVGVVGH